MRMWAVDALSHLWLVVMWAFGCDDWLVFTCSWAVHVRSARALCFALRGSPVTLFHTLRAPSRALRRGHDLSPVSLKLPTERSRFRERETQRKRNEPSSFVSSQQHKPTSSLSLIFRLEYFYWHATKAVQCQSTDNITFIYMHLDTYISNYK